MGLFLDGFWTLWTVHFDLALLNGFDGTFRFRGVRFETYHQSPSARFCTFRAPSKTFIACFLMRRAEAHDQMACHAVQNFHTCYLMVRFVCGAYVSKRTIKAHARVCVRFGAVQNWSKTFVACDLMSGRTVVEVWNFGQDWGESLAGSRKCLDLVWV